jgi:tellurite resistance protein TerC
MPWLWRIAQPCVRSLLILKGGVMETVGAWWMWVGFAVFVVVAILIDLAVLEKQGAHKVTIKEAAWWSVLWFSLSFIFAGILWLYLDSTQGREVANTVSMQFITGYLVEKSLSVDNIFVFLMLFTYFAIPAQLQKRALIIGIVGAIILRALLIVGGAWLLAKFHWLLYVFGAFLVLTGLKMWFSAGQEPDVSNNPVLKFLKKHINITTELDGEKLTTIVQGVKYYTPLFVVLILIGTTDIIFAVDSIPAIFAITSDPFIVLTANIFAILGLRALYFLLADLANRFHLLPYGLALVLVFIGTKMLIIDYYKIPIGIALAVTATLIASSMLISVWSSRNSVENHTEK